MISVIILIDKLSASDCSITDLFYMYSNQPLLIGFIVRGELNGSVWSFNSLFFLHACALDPISRMKLMGQIDRTPCRIEHEQ
jgi:hypothetical protein